jgi:tetratricopeptide (TPR) repeat protein
MGMKCLACGRELAGRICPECGVRQEIIAKVYNLSARHYNRALFLTKDGYYTEAIHSLRKSVAFRKNNTDAQNLLGLVYYRIGRVTDALICWQRSMKIRHEDNLARGYLEELQNSVQDTSRFESVHNYNQALEYLRQDNTDMAVMALKKAIDINKYFVEAHNLMALCYMHTGENNAALRCVNRVLRMDKENETAVSYLRELRPDKFETFEPKEPKTSGGTVLNMGGVERYAGNLIYFIVGVVLCVVVTATLVVPSVVKDYSKRLEQNELSYQVKLNENNELISSNEETINRLSEENESLKSKLYTAGEQELQQRIRTLADIKSLFTEGSVSEAADRLIMLSAQGFSQEAVQEYKELCSTVLPQAAKEYYNKGIAVGKSDYETAVAYFEKCIKCCINDEELKYSATYQLAKLADSEGDSAKAKEYYTTVAENHPVSSVRKEAQRYLDGDESDDEE